MLKKTLLILLALLFIYTMVFAETTQKVVDLSGFTVEDLLSLRELVQAELVHKGYNPYFDLERGDSGEQVSNIQEKLFELGYYSGRISGKLDSETQKALKQFEKDNGLKNDGLPSRDDQLVLFQAKVIAKPTASPTPQATIDPMAEVYQQYGSFDYQDSMRYPEKHEGEKVVLKGKILQVLGNRKNGFQIRFATSGSGDVVYVYINQQLDYNLIEGDFLTIYAVMRKTITYKSTLKVDITIPAAVADYIILR